MKIVLFPPVEESRALKFNAIAGPHEVVNASSLIEAKKAIVDADGFIGKITPELLGNSTKLKWVQSMTASLEHYVFPELINHPSVLTNMRGIFSDVVADHAMGMVLVFQEICIDMPCYKLKVGGLRLEARRVGLILPAAQVLPIPLI